MKEIIIEKLNKFIEWYGNQSSRKVNLTDSNDNTKIEHFNIVVNDNSFTIESGHERLSNKSKKLNESIFKKLDSLDLLKFISFCDIGISLESTQYLEKMDMVSDITLYPEVNNIDISYATSLKSISFSIDEKSTITFPKNIEVAQINIENRNYSPSCLKSIIENTNLSEVMLIALNKTSKIDLEQYNLSNIKKLTIATSDNLEIIVNSNLPSLENFVVHGSIGSSLNTANVKILLPEQLKELTLIDCHIETPGFHNKCRNLKKLTLLGLSTDSENISNIIENNTIIDIHIDGQIFKNSHTKNWNLSKTLRLNLSDCKIENLNFIRNADKLKELDLYNCGLTSFPSNLPRNLNKLVLRRNKGITELPSSPPENINFINVEDCSIVNIPKHYLLNHSIITHKTYPFEEQEEPNALAIYNNPIENPPIEILKGSRENILSYVKSMIGKSNILNEAKIIFVGDGSVGKTSLMKRLVFDQFDATESQTDGIEIEPYVVDLGQEGVVNSTIWDFGGQQILQATHQLFLSKRSIYVLVVEDRKNDKHKDQDIEQWLTQVNSLGGRPPILVVKNKIDENPNSDIQTQKLKSKFPNIIDFFEVSCQKRIGLEKLNQALYECIRSLPMRKIALPKNWLDVKHELKQQALSLDLLYLNTYQDICAQNGITDKFAKDTLLRLLHDLGAVIAFEELKSHNTAILNPHWITEGIYAIIRSEELASNNGVITLHGAQTALDNYSEHNRFEDKASYILDAMRNFELCHATEETNTYLIPALLPPQINLSHVWGDEYNTKKESIDFLFRFEHLLPPPLLPMFLVKMHSYIVGEQRWRSGAIISPTHLDAKALVDADNVTREIKLTIIGDERRDLLVLLRAEINSIAQRLADIDEIGLQEHIVLDDTSETIGYDELIGLKQMGESNFPVGRLGRKFSVSSLLGEIEAPADTERALKVLMHSSKNGLINLNMIQRNDNSATGGSANNTVTTSNSNVNTNHNTATSSVDIKQEFKAFKGQAEFVLEDIREEIEDLTSSDRRLKDYASKECEKVEKAINELTDNVDSQETADENLRHFSRIQNFLDGALKKTNSVGKVIDKAGNVYSEVEKLAAKFNEIAGKFAMPTVALLGVGG